MYLMYVDESGDCGLNNSPSRYFILSGLAIHELRWRSCVDQLVEFRRRLFKDYGLLIRDEIHASHMITRPGHLVTLQKHKRLEILREFADEIASLPDVSIINIMVDKSNKPPNYPVFENAWRALIQRFENTVRAGNFPGPANAQERGMLFPDNTDDRKLRVLVRKLRQYNPIPNNAQHAQGYRNLRLSTVIEDPNVRSSSDSFLIQAVDLVAYLLTQHMAPNAYMKKKGGHNYFLRVKSVLCVRASTKDPLGIVRL